MATIAELDVVLDLDKRKYDKKLGEAERRGALAKRNIGVSLAGMGGAFVAVTAGITVATGVLGKFAQRGGASLNRLGDNSRNAGDAFTGLTLTIKGLRDAAARRVASSEDLIGWFDALAGAMDAAAVKAGQFATRYAAAQRSIAMFEGESPLFEVGGAEAALGGRTAGAGGDLERMQRGMEVQEQFRASLAGTAEEGAAALMEFTNLNDMIEILSGSVSAFEVDAINPLTGKLLDFGDASHLLGTQWIPELDTSMQDASVSAEILRQYVESLNQELSDTEKAARGAALGLRGVTGLGQLFGFNIPFLSNIFGAFSVFQSISGLSELFKAAGGPVSGGTAYMVGERGPEMFVPSQSGTIVPNGGVTINVPPAADPITFARDQQWQRAIQATFRELESGGFRAAT